MDNQDNSQDPSQQNPGLWEYVKQKLAQGNNLQFSDPVTQQGYQQGMKQGMQLGAGTIGGPEAGITEAAAQEAAPTAGSLLGRSAYTDAAPVAEAAQAAVSPSEQALTQMSNNPMSAENTAGLNQGELSQAVNNNSRNIDFQARNAQALAAKKAKALAFAKGNK